MADVEDAPAMPVPAPVPGPATTPTPAPNPDAQTTVNDFLDYTEFYPSDLVRSLTLIGDLDATYAEAVQQVHELTSLYCKLPQLPDRERRLLRALFDRNELSYREVAAHLTMPVGAIGPVRMRALERLPAMLAQAGVTREDLHALAVPA